tara:strand:+ start:241 stop:390 length:150 start_codon:yes stop_codon:yes gene_type:complete
MDRSELSQSRGASKAFKGLVMPSLEDLPLASYSTKNHLPALDLAPWLLA